MSTSSTDHSLPRGERRAAVRSRPRARAVPRLTLATVLVLVLAAAHVLLVAATPIAGGPRDTMAQRAPVERWTPPSPSVDARFATFSFVGATGREGIWVLPTNAVPLRFVVEREVVERFGRDELDDAVEVWNDTAGSRFGASIVAEVEDGVEERRRDGVDRIYLDRRSCGTRYLARANMWPGEVVAREGRVARTIAEVDIGLCDRLQPEQLETVMAHELAHIAGLDHLCDEGEDCHRPGMDADNRCRMMSPRLHPCQEIRDGDLDGLVHLHPRLPRASGGDARTTSASVTTSTHPVPRTAPEVVLSAYDGDPALGVTAASHAAHLGAPHLMVDADCTSGPDGQGLDRALTLAGRALLIGEVAPGCAETLEGAWAIETTALRDAREVHDATAAHLGAPSRLVVTASPDGPDEVALASVSATAATLFEAPLVLVTDPLDPDPILETLAELPSVTEVVVVGDAARVDARMLAAVAADGLEVRRIDATDGGEAVTALARIAEIAPAADLAVAVAAADRPEHLVPAVALAGRAEGLLLPVDPEPRPAHQRLLREQVTRGALVGGTQAIGRDLQITLSRWVDGG